MTSRTATGLVTNTDSNNTSVLSTLIPKQHEPEIDLPADTIKKMNSIPDKS